MRTIAQAPFVQTHATYIPNGNSDDAPLQAYLNTQAANGKQTAYFASGTALISGAITWPSQIKTIVCDDPAGFTLRSANGNTAVQMLSPNGAISGPRLYGITLDGNYQNHATGLVGGIDLGSFAHSDVEIDDCKFLNMGANSGAFNFQGSGITVSRSLFRTSRASALRLTGASNIRITGGNQFDDYNRIVGNWPAISLLVNGSTPCTKGIISGNNFNCLVASNEFAIECVSSTDGLWFSGWVINGNVFDANGLGGSGVSGQFAYSVVSDNVFLNGVNTQRSGIEIGGPKNKISDNVIYNGLIVVTRNNPAWVDNYGNSVDDNIIYQASSTFAGMMAIQVKGVKDTSIKGNKVFFEPSGSATVNTGIYLGFYGASDTLDNVNVLANEVSVIGSAQGQGIRVNSTSSTKVTIADNNKCRNMLHGILLPATSVDVDLVVASNDMRGNTNPLGSNTPTGTGLVMKNNLTTSAKTTASITVGASPFVYTASQKNSEQVLISGGTVTNLEMSVDGGTNWYSFATLGVGQVDLIHGESLRVTYSVAPTMRRVMM